METLSAATQEDSSGANPSSVKSEDNSPHHEGGRGSPPPNCAICLGRCRNKSFTDSCLHQFCFKCLLTWSKVKTECPLCKQNFRSIIHNVRSNHQYEEYMVEQRQSEEATDRIDIDELATAARRFRYRTTLTLPRRESIAIQQLLLHYPLMAGVFPAGGAPAAAHRRRRSPASFRRTVYRHNLWARPLPDFTGRFRDCTPEFYRYNDSQMHRLVPWLNRELHYLLNENIGHISYVMTRILELLRQYHINSGEFRETMHRYFGDRTEHFLHELYCFASTPYDMTGYDRNVQYTTDTRISTMVNEISSSESDASIDSDIVMVSSSEPTEPPPGPSRLPAPVYPYQYIPLPNDNVIPIETISQSDTDDDSSEVMVVGYIKPPQERTPEVVDLLGSDSDVIVQENSQTETTQEADAQESQPTPLVKLTLKRLVTPENGDSDTDETVYQPPPSRRRRRPRSNDTATTSDTCRGTPSPSLSPIPSSPFRSPTTMSDTFSDTFSDYTSSSDEKSSRATRKKSKRKTSKESSSKDRKRNKRRPRTYHKDRKSSQVNQSDKDKRCKHKSHSGKGVKCSKKMNLSKGDRPEPTVFDINQPGTSGTSSNHRRGASRERKRSRCGRESRRLKSVVNVMNSHKRGESSSSRISASTSSTTSTTAGTAGKFNEESAPVAAKKKKVKDVATETNDDFSDAETRIYQMSASRGTGGDSSDSEDDLPLNLTVKKTYPLSH